MIITITRRNSDNNNSNDNNPFQVVRPQSLVHKYRTQTIFKHKTKHWSKKNAPARWQRLTVMLMQWKMKYSAQLDKKHPLRDLHTTENKLGRKSSNFAPARWLKCKKWMYKVSNNETILKCKTKRWRLFYVTWNIVIYQDNTHIIPR